MVLITMLFQVVARNKLFTNSVSGKNSFLASSSIKLFVALLGKSISRTYVWFSYCSMTLKIFTVIYSTQANSSVFQTVHFLLFRILRSHWYWSFDRIYDFFFFLLDALLFERHGFTAKMPPLRTKIRFSRSSVVAWKTAALSI